MKMMLLSDVDHQLLVAKRSLSVPTERKFKAFRDEKTRRSRFRDEEEEMICFRSTTSSVLGKRRIPQNPNLDSSSSSSTTSSVLGKRRTQQNPNLDDSSSSSSSSLCPVDSKRRRVLPNETVAVRRTKPPVKQPVKRPVRREPPVVLELNKNKTHETEKVITTEEKCSLRELIGKAKNKVEEKRQIDHRKAYIESQRIAARLLINQVVNTAGFDDHLKYHRELQQLGCDFIRDQVRLLDHYVCRGVR